MVTVRKKACLLLLPSIVFVVWSGVFTMLGAFALIADQNLKHQPCGKQTHLWKYTLLNVVFTFVSTVSFFFFPGGGEGARARALVLTIFNAGFATWGFLLWFNLSDVCSSILNGQYTTIFTFHHLGLAYNSIIFLFMFIHEAWLGNHLNGDYTLMAEIHHKPPNPGFNSPGPHKYGPPADQQIHGVVMPPNMMSPHGATPDMGADIMSEYKDISNTGIKTGVTLPKSEP